MKKNKLLITALTLGVLVLGTTTTIPVHAASTAGQETVSQPLEHTAPVTANLVPSYISVTVPTAFEFSVDSEGVATTTSEIANYIENKTPAPVKVASAAIQNTGVWQCVAFDSYNHTHDKVDQKKFAIKLNTIDVTATDFSEKLSKQIGVIYSTSTKTGKASRYTFDNVQAKFSIQSTPLAKTQIANIVMTIDFASQADAV